MKPAYVSTNVDKININARHFAAMSKDKAIEAMIADGITKDKVWAGKVYEQAVKDVAEADAPPPVK